MIGGTIAGHIHIMTIVIVNPTAMITVVTTTATATTIITEGLPRGVAPA